MKRIASAIILASSLSTVNAADFSHDMICKAAIATAMYKPVEILKSEKKEDLTTVSYVRKADGQSFFYQCKIDQSKVVWRTKIDGAWGRWRDTPDDSAITYKITDGKLFIDEAGNSNTYPASAFR